MKRQIIQKLTTLLITALLAISVSPSLFAQGRKDEKPPKGTGYHKKGREKASSASARRKTQTERRQKETQLSCVPLTQLFDFQDCDSSGSSLIQPWPADWQHPNWQHQRYLACPSHFVLS